MAGANLAPAIGSFLTETQVCVMVKRPGTFSALVVGVWLAVFFAGCDGSNCPDDAGRGSASVAGPLSDEALRPYQSKLLDLAFDAVTTMPVDPHIKDRSRAQGDVVTVCLRLNQPARALRYCEKILNWRRGECYADYALYCADAGESDQARRYIQQAAKISDGSSDWRRDRIRAKIARTHALLGDHDQARRIDANVGETEQGKLSGVLAARDGNEPFQEHLRQIDRAATSGNHDLLQNVLRSSARLYGVVYADIARRDALEEKIKSSWKPLPIFMRVDLLMDLSGIAVDHGDKARSLALLDEAQTIVAGARWPARYQVTLLARLGRLRSRAGDRDKAVAQLKEALSVFDSRRRMILDIERAGALRAVAEAWYAIGEASAALDTYKRAIEAGCENRNSRPRAEDLSATCCSMALVGARPDAAMWDRMRKIYEGLGDPW